RWLARLVHRQKTWFTPGSTMTNGQPPQPIFTGSKLDCYCFLPSVMAPDNRLHEQLLIAKDPVHFLWVVPITLAECEYIRAHDAGAFLDILDQEQHPLVLNEKRKSYVRGK